MLDIKLFLRVPSNILKSRREERQTYVLQSKSLLSRSPLKADPNDAAAGGVWTDPPNYFEQIVYPAYVKAHEHIFENGDVENGKVKSEGLHVLQPLEGKEEMTKCFKESCEIIQRALE
jgi:nicotinamide/nicotinate riboside kinase